MCDQSKAQLQKLKQRPVTPILLMIMSLITAFIVTLEPAYFRWKISSRWRLNKIKLLPHPGASVDQAASTRTDFAFRLDEVPFSDSDLVG